MMVNKFSDDKVLLKLHRRYGADEALKYLFEEISKLRFNIGELKSENAELSDKNNELVQLLKTEQSKTKKQKRSVQPEWKLEDYVIELEASVNRVSGKNAELRKEVNKWRNNYFDALAKLEKLKNKNV